MRLAGATALVTGGAGFIGSHLVDHLIDRGVSKVVVVDTLWLGRERQSRVRPARGDPISSCSRTDAADADGDACRIERHRVESCSTSPRDRSGNSFTDPRGAYMTSVDIAVTLAELLRAGVFGRLVHYSTSEIYGDAVAVPMSEDHPVAADDALRGGQAGRRCTAAVVDRAVQDSGLTIRPFNNYGPRQNDRDYGAVIPVTIRRLASGLPPILEGTGDQTRDFTFVKDTVRLTADLCENGRRVGSDGERRVCRDEVRIGDLIQSDLPRNGIHRRHRTAPDRGLAIIAGISRPLRARVSWCRSVI